MKDDLPPLHWLRAFEAAARHLSFTGAAGELHMTQSAVSQQIKALEGALGHRLFDRRPRGLVLTAEGMTFLPVVREAFGTLRRGTRAVTGAARDRAVVLQCSLTLAVTWLAPRLADLRAAHPDIRLEIRTELWAPPGFAEGADVEVRFALAPDPGLEPESLFRPRQMPVAAPGLEVTQATLPELPLFACAGLMSSWDSWAEARGLDWPRPPVTMAGTYLVGMAAAETGGGVALVNDLVAADALAAGRLTAPFGTGDRMPEAYYMILPPGAEGRSGPRRVSGWLREQFAGLVL